MTLIWACLTMLAVLIACLAFSVARLWRLTEAARREHKIIHDLMTGKIQKDLREAEKRVFG